MVTDVLLSILFSYGWAQTSKIHPQPNHLSQPLPQSAQARPLACVTWTAAIAPAHLPLPSRPLSFATVHSPPRSVHSHMSQTVLLSCPLPSSAIRCPRTKCKGSQAWHILTSHDLICSPLPNSAPDTLVSSVPETPKGHSSHRALALAVFAVWDLGYPSNIHRFVQALLHPHFPTAPSKSSTP